MLDRLKVVLLKDMGWTYALIAKALFLDEDMVGRQMNEIARNNVFSNAAREFRDAINGFFEALWPEHAYASVDHKLKLGKFYDA